MSLASSPRAIREEEHGIGAKSHPDLPATKHHSQPIIQAKSHGDIIRDHQHTPITHVSKKDRLAHQLKKEWSHDPEVDKRASAFERGKYSDQHDRHPNTRDKRMKQRKLGIKGKKHSGAGSKFTWGEPLQSQLAGSDVPADVLAGSNNPADPNYVSPAEREQQRQQAQEENWEENDYDYEDEGDKEFEDEPAPQSEAKSPSDITQEKGPISQPPTPSANEFTYAQAASSSAATSNTTSPLARYGNSCML
jgi:hypothetical protein